MPKMEVCDQFRMMCGADDGLRDQDWPAGGSRGRCCGQRVYKAAGAMMVEHTSGWMATRRRDAPHAPLKHV